MSVAVLDAPLLASHEAALSEPPVKRIPSSKSLSNLQKRPRGNPLFGKGNRLAARNRGTQHMGTLLVRSIRGIEREGWRCACATPCKRLVEHFIRRAGYSDRVLVAVMNKLVPDLQHRTGDPGPVSVTIQYAHAQTTLNLGQQPPGIPTDPAVPEALPNQPNITIIDATAQVEPQQPQPDATNI